MIRFLTGVFLSLTLLACAPVERSVPATVCTSRPDLKQMYTGNWLQQPGVWHLRQSVLLELGPRKIPLEGLLRLDTLRHEARLVAMNEMGLVLFDLQLDQQGQTLLRGMPQLQKQPGFAVGVAKSLRQIFLSPLPETSDQLELYPDSQQLWRALPGGRLTFTFSCSGDLRETRKKAETDDWRTVYSDYQPLAGSNIPQHIQFNDYRHRVKLSLWLGEVKRKDE